MTEPRFGVNRRALFGLGAVLALGIAAAQVLPNVPPPPIPDAPVPPVSNAPAYPVDLPTPPENVAVTALSDTELAARGITRVRLGEIEFRSGAIVAADPLVQPERPPFARKVKPARYEITLLKAAGRNALMVLRFAPGVPTRWQLALLPGQDARKLKSDEIFGYPVDTGLGSFMDVVARDALLKRDRQEQARQGSHYSNLYDDVLAAPLEAAGNTQLLFQPIAGEAATVAIVQSGWGDGFYATYWGLDAKGEPLLLVTDFGVLEKGDGRPPEKKPAR